VTGRPSDPTPGGSRRGDTSGDHGAPATVRAGGLLAATLVVLTALLASGGAVGAGPRKAAQEAPTIEIVSPPRVVKGDTPFSLEVRVTGAPDDAVLGLGVHAGMSSRGEFRATLEDDDDLGARILDPVSEPLADLTDGTTGTAEIAFVPADAGLGRNVYPVEVQLRGPDGSELARQVTYLAYVPDAVPEFPPLEVVVLADIAAPPALQADGDTALSRTEVDHALQRVEAVEQAGNARVTLAPLPETLEALARVDGGAGGRDGGAVVDRLASLAERQQVLARPFVDVDLGELQAAGLTNDPSEANEQAESGADVVRDRLGVEPVGGRWLSGDTWGEASAHLAAQLGIGHAIVPPSAVRDGESNNLHYNPVRLDDGGPTAMVSDPALAAHLTGADGMVDAHRFLADLAITWLEAPLNPRAVVVHLPPDGAIDPDVVGAALAALPNGQVTTSATIGEIFADTPPSPDGPTDVVLTPDAPGPDLSGIAPALRAARQQVSGVGALLDDPQRGAQLKHSLLLATGTDTPDAERAAYVEHASAGIRDVDGAVTLPPEFRITLTARSSTIPVRLTNNLDSRVTVRVELESDQLEFPQGRFVTETLPPGTSSLDVPVRARTSGAFTMDVRVTSPDGALVLDRSTFDVRSTAISGVGLVLSVGAGLFLAVWWARNWHKSRRTTDPPPPDGGDTAPDTGSRTDGTAPASAQRSPDAAGEPAVHGTATGTLAPWATSGRSTALEAPPATGPTPPGSPSPHPSAPAPPAPPATARPSTGAPSTVPATEPARHDDPDAEPRAHADDAPYRPAHMAASGRRRPGGLSLRSTGTRVRRR
jgi:hypothetical protein